MKKILIVVVVVLAVAGIVGLTVMRAQSGYTKVLTGKVVQGNLTSVVSGTGQIKPKTYVNLGATAMGRITHLYVKEGDRVKRGQTVASIESVQQNANVQGQKAAIAAANTDISAYVAAEKTAEANVEHAKADLEQKQLDYKRALALYNEKLIAKQDFDAKKAAYDTDMATLAQSQAALAQAKAQTDSARAHMETQVSMLRANEDLLGRTVAIAPFDGLVTNLPVREGETVVEGIQNAEGSTLMTLADTSVLTAEVKVDETDIVNVAMGQPADVTVDALPGKVFKGHVTEVGDQALLRSTGVATSQSTSGTEEAKDFKVVVTLDQANDQLKPGLSATAKITTASRKDVLSIPIQALTMRSPDQLKDASNKSGVVSAASAPAPNGTDAQQKQGVFVVRQEGGKLHATFVPVTTGITGTTDIEVTSGLKQGDEIVIGTYRTLRDLKNNALVKRDKTPPPVPKDDSSSGS
ncbi:efflux RND transporter periplasmic adaptor subunit [Acidipila rosea]|uniref:HlyD family secretion protein n=1 Tax=Acidipila rosea TaxID=768535 RepID=A0A4R1LAQ0_9BACT|nr:efflux RND transporter periplasmic adaptor subunit [Acidipila rosea]TCK73539.1 HlyD family secretion protein [Acidipila rosea]